MRDEHNSIVRKDNPNSDTERIKNEPRVSMLVELIPAHNLTLPDFKASESERWCLFEVNVGSKCGHFKSNKILVNQKLVHFSFKSVAFKLILTYSPLTDPQTVFLHRNPTFFRFQ